MCSLWSEWYDVSGADSSWGETWVSSHPAGPLSLLVAIIRGLGCCTPYILGGDVAAGSGWVEVAGTGADSGESKAGAAGLDISIGSDCPRIFPRLATPTSQVSWVV
jgi:hypothetical protein